MSEAKKFRKMDEESIAGLYYGSADSASSFSKSSMLPPPYPQTHFISLSLFKAAINARLDGPVVSLLRPTVWLLQVAFALASGVSYAIELDHRYSASTTNFIYAEVVFGLTLLTLIIDSVTLRSYRFIWAIEWTLAILWIACFSVFYGVYLNGEIPADYAVVDPRRMRIAGWCNLVNALLWLGSALFSSMSCCSGIKAAMEVKLEKRRQRKENRTVVNKVQETKIGTFTAKQV
ncbi:hypothetical protein BU25DRAFT_409375 [Macroventuria anomochaeta]|uniref:Uncharacterized protein n=1 Tax=Macroventuria anomochaeta TaxID=301207 RepID=A0ACB6S3Y7_9PLEO|nr:uncharacterized protein BU25DRAFT_409375 [Macroventuria anomochaeta]KAF2628871.1 hypothetical protein BU25DRAFT_409375 [Macroventuria anomochaeta]